MNDCGPLGLDLGPNRRADQFLRRRPSHVKACSTWEKRLTFKLTQLRDFVAVARHGSLRGAARDLNLGQPTLTKSIQALEKELGAALFVRSVSGALLTAQGSAFLPTARLVLEELRRGQRQVTQLADPANGEVTVGLCPTSCALFLGPMLASFRRRFPSAAVRIIEDGHSIRLLRDGELDFLIGPPPVSPRSEDLSIERLISCPTAVIGRSGHPRADATRLEKLMDAEWVRPAVEGRPSIHWESVFTSRGLSPPPRLLEVDNLYAAMHLLIKTDALCISPIAIFESLPSANAFIQLPLEDLLPELPISLIHSSGLPLTPAATAMADQARRTAGQLTRQRLIN